MEVQRKQDSDKAYVRTADRQSNCYSGFDWGVGARSCDNLEQLHPSTTGMPQFRRRWPRYLSQRNVLGSVLLQKDRRFVISFEQCVFHMIQQIQDFTYYTCLRNSLVLACDILQFYTFWAWHHAVDKGPVI